MLKMNRKVEYALIALKYMSGKYAGQLTSVKEVCDETGVPFDATARAMQLMVQGGLLKSEHGVHGGYLLLKDLSHVHFHELLSIVSGPVEMVKCLHSDEACELAGSCTMQGPLSVLNRRMVDFFSELSVAEILQPKARPAQRIQQ